MILYILFNIITVSIYYIYFISVYYIQNVWKYNYITVYNMKMLAISVCVLYIYKMEISCKIIKYIIKLVIT